MNPFRTSTGALLVPEALPNKVDAVRMTHTVTAGEVSAGAIIFTVNWDQAFPDTNYTVVVGVCRLSGTGGYLATVEVKQPSSITTAVVAAPLGNLVAGDVIEINFIAIHD